MRPTMMVLVALTGAWSWFDVAMAETVIDMSGYQADCAVKVSGFNGHLIIQWPTSAGEVAEVSLDLGGQNPLFERMSLLSPNAERTTILERVDPVWYVTVGSRQPAADKPSERKWEVFFDNPQRRPHQTHPSQLSIQNASVRGSNQRAIVTINGLTAGPFAGAIQLSFYAGSRMVRVDAALRTDQDLLAVFYDCGLIAEQASWRQVAWMDTRGQLQRRASSEVSNQRGPDAAGDPEIELAAPPPGPQSPLPQQAITARHRLIVAESAGGAVACFPPPHQFQFPRDFSTNLGFVWAGEGYQGQTGKVGFGVRQHKDGGGNYVPWFNAPPGVTHRMGSFLLLTSGDAKSAMDETLKLTHGDRFEELPGFKTFTSHFHMATAVKAMREQEAGFKRQRPPAYVQVLKELGVNLVHQGEFHGDGHPRDPGPLRLPEMKAMFDECRQWSDENFLLMPGEEANEHLGLRMPGKPPGHWMCIFPRQVYWTMVRGGDQPFQEQLEPYGKVYHVGSRGDMIRLLKEEHGLAWTAHPRIKASSWTPDAFRNEDFFLAEFWLGGAWKAMPGDLSREKLGERVLGLMDDMANWGQRKMVPGEVDVFTIDSTHELYGHMNVNYVQLDRVPRFDEGWQSVLEVLSQGRFFVTTGEILIPRFQVGGKGSGEVLHITTENPPQLEAEVRWTFPLAFAEVISGDGREVYRERIDLTDTAPLGTRQLKFQPNLQGRRWVRFEVWDVAANGAFTQPVWLD